jgi:hypothetical protein
MTLYELADDYAALIEAIENDELPEEAIADTLEAVAGEFEDKAESVAVVIKSIKAEADSIKAEEDVLKARREAKENKAKYLSGYLATNMERLNIKKIDKPRAVLSFRKSTALVVDDEQGFIKRHADLCRVESYKIPRKAVTDMLKAGKTVAGARLEERQNLQVK